MKDKTTTSKWQIIKGFLCTFTYRPHGIIGLRLVLFVFLSHSKDENERVSSIHSRHFFRLFFFLLLLFILVFLFKRLFIFSLAQHEIFTWKKKLNKKSFFEPHFKRLKQMKRDSFFLMFFLFIFWNRFPNVFRP